MNWLKINTLRNYTIEEISSTSFQNLESWEIQVQSDFNFPSSQNLYFYRWNGLNIENNDEETIIIYYNDKKTLSGLHMKPFIESVLGGDFIPNSSKEIIINGENFSPYCKLKISGSGNVINSISCNNSKQLIANITVSNIEGLFNLIVINGNIDSSSSGNNTINVKSKSIVDLRTTSIDSLGLDMTTGITVQQNESKGIYFNTGTTSWNRGVKLTAFPWFRNENIIYEVIFTKNENATFMLGLCDESLVVNPIYSAYYAQEIGMYISNNTFSSMYGGGDITNWSQSIGTSVTLNNNLFFKLKLSNSGSNGAACSIWTADPDDWDNENELYSWVSNCPAAAQELVPFILPQSSASTYFITGFRY